MGITTPAPEQGGVSSEASPLSFPTRGLPPAKQAAACERRVRALELRKAGHSYREIGRQLGISHVQAEKDVTRVLAELNAQATETAESWRRLELERLDALWVGIWRQALSGHPLAVASALKIMERRAKLLGLDAPQRMELDVQRHAEQLASELGLSVDAVLAEAERIVGAGSK